MFFPNRLTECHLLHYTAQYMRQRRTKSFHARHISRVKVAWINHKMCLPATIVIADQITLHIFILITDNKIGRWSVLYISFGLKFSSHKLLCLSWHSVSHFGFQKLKCTMRLVVTGKCMCIFSCLKFIVIENRFSANHDMHLTISNRTRLRYYSVPSIPRLTQRGRYWTVWNIKMEFVAGTLTVRPHKRWKEAEKNAASTSEAISANGRKSADIAIKRSRNAYGTERTHYNLHFRDEIINNRMWNQCGAKWLGRLYTISLGNLFSIGVVCVCAISELNSESCEQCVLPETEDTMCNGPSHNDGSNCRANALDRTQYREQLKGAQNFRFILLLLGCYKTNEMFLMYLSHCSPVVLFIFCVSVARRSSASSITLQNGSFLPPSGPCLVISTAFAADISVSCEAW